MIYDKEWYDSLIKPKFQPPDWIFKLVWTVLYITMLVAFILVLIAPFRLISSILAYLFFFAQIGVNLQWAPAFFKEHNLRKAFGLSALLAILVLFTMLVFFHVSALAGILFLPYFIWCSYACLLSFEILELNEW